MRKKQKKIFFFEKKNSKWPTQKNTKKAVLALFWAYVGQPDGHIG